MDKRQSAVEWLVEQLIDEVIQGKLLIPNLIEQAKAMEKQQIIDANEDCSTNELGELLTGEQYYTSTYGQ